MLYATDIHRWRRLLSNASGFSFIDVLIALVVLTIGVLAIADLQVISKNSNTSSKSMTSAITIAETQMEVIKGTAYGDIVTFGPTQVTDSGTTYTQQVQVTDNSPAVNLKTVKITVTWTDKTGIAHTVPMSTVIAQ